MRLDLQGSAYLPDQYISDSGAKLEVYRRFAGIRSEADVEACDPSFATASGPFPRRWRVCSAVAVRMAAEAAGVPEVRVEPGRVTLKWTRYARQAVVTALTVAGFARGRVEPGADSRGCRRDGIDVALRALGAIGSAATTPA